MNANKWSVPTLSNSWRCYGSSYQSENQNLMTLRLIFAPGAGLKSCWVVIDGLGGERWSEIDQITRTDHTLINIMKALLWNIEATHADQRSKTRAEIPIKGLCRRCKYLLSLSYFYTYFYSKLHLSCKEFSVRQGPLQKSSMDILSEWCPKAARLTCLFISLR